MTTKTDRLPKGTRVVVKTREGDCWCEGATGEVVGYWLEDFVTVQLDQGMPGPARFAAHPWEVEPLTDGNDTTAQAEALRATYEPGGSRSFEGRADSED